MKATKWLLEGHEVDPSCKYSQYVRQRHARQFVGVGGKAHGIVAVRGWAHLVDIEGVTGQSWSGPLTYRSKDWIEQRGGHGDDDKFKGKAWQGSELIYFGPNVSRVKLGEPSGGQPSTYPALNNYIDPNIQHVEEGVHEKTHRASLSGFRQLWQMAGLL
jgi:hypothetical protein